MTERPRTLVEEMEEMARLPVHPTMDTYPIRCGCCDKLFVSPNRNAIFCEKCENGEQGDTVAEKTLVKQSGR